MCEVSAATANRILFALVEDGKRKKNARKKHDCKNKQGTLTKTQNALLVCMSFLRSGEIQSFLIEDSKKAFYYRGLAEWKNEKGYLLDTCLDGQDAFQRLLAMFDIE